MNDISAKYTTTQNVVTTHNTIIQRATRRADGMAVILKRVAPSALTQATVARLHWEYEILKHLAQSQVGTGVVRAVEMFGVQDNAVLVLEDLGGTSLDGQGAQPFEQTLTVILAVVQAVAQTHRACVVHLDINPSNIVFNATTGIVQLIDFGIADRTTRALGALSSNRQMHGTLPFMSPEQTGQVDKPIDYRSDYYGLGATLYQFLTGRKPFDAADPKALLQAVLTERPTPPHNVRADVAPMLSEITLKLMEKDPSERYQSSQGIVEDLQRCRDELRRHGRVEKFVLSQRERNEHFTLPQKIYGRQREMQVLQTCFEHVEQGAQEVVFISGVSGIGKSSLVAHIQNASRQQGHLYLAGKHEQLQRHVPFGAFSQAIAEWVDKILQGSPEAIETWRRRISGAVGNIGQALVTLAPSLGLLLGEQKPLPTLPAAQNENRLTTLLTGFLQAVSRDQPLVLFLDDVQWADAGTVRLIEYVATQKPKNTAGILIAVTYRSEEVTADAPLAVMLRRLKSTAAVVNEITLGPLAVADIADLVQDTTHAPRPHSEALAAMVAEKTAGNPFFIRSLLQHMHAAGVVTFDVGTQSWNWRQEDVANLHVTTNVVSILAEKMHTMPLEGRNLLGCAACLGTAFDVHGACDISGIALDTAHRLYAEAAELGFIASVGNDYRYATDLGEKVTYRFVHDRVQQIAYDGLAPQTRDAYHLAIGKRLWRADSANEQVFATLGHLNRVPALLATHEERSDLVRLNVSGAKLARKAGAYQVALTYLNAAQSIAQSQGAHPTHAALLREIEFEIADLEFLSAQPAQAIARLAKLAEHSPTPVQAAEADSHRVTALGSMNQLDEALRVGAAALAKLGHAVTYPPTKGQVVSSALRTLVVLMRRGLKDLHKIPPVTDPEMAIALDILGNMGMPAYCISEDMLAYVVLTAPRWTVQYGMSPTGAFAFTMLSVLLAQRNQYPIAHQYVEAALQLVASVENSTAQAAVYFCSACFVSYAYLDLPALQEHYRHGFALGRDTGDPLFGGWCAVFVSVTVTYVSLPEMQRAFDDYEPYIKLRAEPQQVASMAQLHTFMLGMRQAAPDVVAQASAQTRQEAEKVGDSTSARYAVFVTPMFALRGEWQAALQVVDYGFQRMVFKRVSEHALLPFCFFGCVAYCRAAMAGAPMNRRDKGRFGRMLHKLKSVAAVAPQSYGGLLRVVQAEQATLQGDFARAYAIYEQANTILHDCPYVGWRAFALELTGRAYVAGGQEIAAEAHFTRSVALYRIWGAEGKVVLMRNEMAFLAQPRELETTITAAGRTWTTGGDGPGAVPSVDALPVLSDLLLRMQDPGVTAQVAANDAMASLKSTLGATRLLVLHSVEEAAGLEGWLRQAINLAMRSNHLVLAQDPRAVAALLQEPGADLPKCLMCFCVQDARGEKLILYADNNAVSDVFTARKIELGKLWAQCVLQGRSQRILTDAFEKALAVETERLQQKEQQRSQGEREAVELQMAGGFAHEMRNALSGATYPLALISNSAHFRSVEYETICDGTDRLVGELQAKQADAEICAQLRENVASLRELMEQIAGGLARGQRITEQILDYASATQLVVSDEATDLSAVVNNIVSEYRTTLAENHIQVKLHAAAPATAYIREPHAYAIIRNLIANAKDALNAVDRQDKQIDVRFSVAPHAAIVEVQDNGCGMTPEVQKRVFQPFFSTKSHAGTGLGLGFARKLATAYGGKITFESEQGLTLFRVELPRRD